MMIVIDFTDVPRSCSDRTKRCTDDDDDDGDVMSLKCKR